MATASQQGQDTPHTRRGPVEMLRQGVSNYMQHIHIDYRWSRLRLRLTIAYIFVALILLLISGLGDMRFFQALNKPFGGFFWAIDPDSNTLLVVSTPTELPPFQVTPDSLTHSMRIIEVDHQPAAANITRIYQQAKVDQPIIYTIEQDGIRRMTITRPASLFTLDMWLQSYGLPLLAGFCWLLVGLILLVTARNWSSAVEGITLLPTAMLLLLFSHWGNVQVAPVHDLIVPLLWLPAFALLGGAFIHLSLTYRPRALSSDRQPNMLVDLLPYLPLLALLAYEWSSLLLFHHVPLRVNASISILYATLGGLISFVIGLNSLLQVGRLPFERRQSIKYPPHVQQRIGDLLTLWIGGIGLGCCLGVLPIALIGHPLLSLPMFYILAAVYPLILLYAIRSLRLIDRLHVTLREREQALREQEQTASRLRETNTELKQATSLLLHADSHLRSILSQRLHDQPKQQALRIRSLLGHWQHKLRVEAERDSEGKVVVPPIIEALTKVRKISEELENDLRGLQLLIEDVYQRRSLGLRLHLEKLVQEDLPGLHPESPLKIQTDLWALDVLSPGLEQSEEGERIAEAISYTVTQALLNIYNHAGATYATIRTRATTTLLEVIITDDGRGFNPQAIPPEKTSLFKARLKVREANGTIEIQSVPRPHPEHGTKIVLRIPLPDEQRRIVASPSLESQYS